MTETFFIADTHFGHQGIVKFDHHDGTPMRPFDTWQENDLTIADRWNQKVRSRDKVYLIGDYAFSALGHRMVKLLNGDITLVGGNHDQKRADHYIALGFKDVVGVKQLGGYWLTHMPMHIQCVMEERVTGNIHGHLHRNHVLMPGGQQHPKYFCVSVENINFEPISFDDIKIILDRSTF